jgi:TPR repeat protein
MFPLHQLQSKMSWKRLLAIGIVVFGAIGAGEERGWAANPVVSSLPKTNDAAATKPTAQGLASAGIGSTEPLQTVQSVDSVSGPDTSWTWFNVGLSNQLGQAAGTSSQVLDAYSKAAQSQNSPALLNLGYLHETGQGVPKDISKAINYYRQAAELGNPVALFNLGRSYYTGTNGLPLDWTAARKHLEHASGEGLVAAQHLLGQLNLDQNQASNAAVWFTRAAEHGFVPSMCSLAGLYHYGRGVSVDASRAIQWYRRAAEFDFVLAQYQLGILYDSGNSVQNPVLAEMYLRKAALHGHRESQYLLGQYYYRGRVLKPDMAEVYRWWSLSEASGLEVAAAARRQLLRIITPADLERGRTLVSEFQPKPSTFHDDSVATIQSNSRLTDEPPSAFGSGCIVSAAGHVLTSAAHVPSSARGITVSIIGGKLRATPVKVDQALGLAVVQIQGGSRSFHSLSIQTNRNSALPGTWVFCMNMAPGGIASDSLQPNAHRSRVLRNSGLKADPRYLTLSDRMPTTTLGAPVLDISGQIVGIVVDPAPKSSSTTGAIALSARYIQEFLRANGVSVEAGTPVEERGEAAPPPPLVANNSLVHVTSYSSQLP